MVAIVVLEFFSDQAQWNYHKAKGAYQKTAKVPSDLKYTREQLDSMLVPMVLLGD